MRKQKRVLGLGMVATILVAACSGSTATQLPRARRRRQRRRPAAASEAPGERGPRPARRPRSGSSSSGRPRRSSPATSPRTTQGYYAAENLEVDILDGGPTIVPQQVGSAPDGPEFTISWVPKVLEAREARLRPRRHRPDLPALRHAVGRRGRTAASPTSAKRSRARRSASWDFGNEFEVTAGLALNCGLTPGLENNGDPATQYQKVIQAVRHGRVPEQARSTRPRR